MSNTDQDEFQVPTIDRAQAKLHLAFIDADAPRFTFQTYDDDKERSVKTKVDNKGRDHRARTIIGSLDQRFDELVAANSDGRAVHVTINHTTGFRRTAADVDLVRKHFVEIDGKLTLDQILALPLVPAFVTESSPGNFHVYFNIADDVAADTAGFKQRQAKLAVLYDGGRESVDLPRVLRLAGFLHQKDEFAPWMVRIVHDDAAAPAYTIAGFDQVLGDIEVPTTITGERAEQPAAEENAAAIEAVTEFFKRATAAISNTPTGKHQKQGNDTTYMVMCFARDEGVEQETCYELAVEHYNPRCQPPWSEAELRTIIKNAYAHAQNTQGKERAKAEFTEDEDPESIKPKGDGYASDEELFGGKAEGNHKFPEPIKLFDLMRGNYPRQSYLLDGLIMERVVNKFDGDGGAGKTTVAVQMGIAIAAGQPLFDRKAHQAPVLLVLSEDSNGETKYRCGAALKGMKIDNHDLPLTTWCLPGEDIAMASVTDEGKVKLLPFYRRLDKWLTENPGAFVVLDNIADIAIMSEAGRLAPTAFLKRVLGGLVVKHGCTILVLAHPSKASMADGTYSSGSTAYKNAVRNNLVIKKLKGGGRSFERSKNNYASDDEKIRLIFADGIYTPLGAGVVSPAEQGRYRAVLNAIKAVLANGGLVASSNRGGDATPDSIATAVTADGVVTVTGDDVKAFMTKALAQGDLRYRAADRNLHTKATFIVPDYADDVEPGGDDEPDQGDDLDD